MTARRVVSSGGADGPVTRCAVTGAGEYFFTSVDMVDVTYTSMVRNANTVPIPSTISVIASDSNCPVSTLIPHSAGQGPSVN